MKVIRADAMGLCFGVRDALAAAQHIEEPETVTIHGQLVHNEAVLVQLESHGFQMTSEQQRRPIPETPNVLITAHGISEFEKQRLEAAGRRLIDTTCPLVRRVHDSARALADDGFHVLLIGRPRHVEVLGIVEDLPRCDVVAGPDDVRLYPHGRLGVVCQSTTSPRRAQEVYAAIRTLNPHAQIRLIDTICQPTRDRQQALDSLSRRVEAMVVVGGTSSNNTRALIDRCREQRVPAVHVQSAADIDPEWFRPYRTVGLTAGTSTLDVTIEEVYDALCRL